MQKTKLICIWIIVLSEEELRNRNKSRDVRVSFDSASCFVHLFVRLLFVVVVVSELLIIYDSALARLMSNNKERKTEIGVMGFRLSLPLFLSIRDTPTRTKL
ncbi:hypothetical protein K439DRAFT_855238 [Ramaria rubella]|nr:hypothetical protein K439DRAFT_855238 [Ramaria rubella]